MNISLRDAAALEGINADTSCGAESDHQERTGRLEECTLRR